MTVEQLDKELQEIGVRVRARREALGMTRDYLSEQIGVTPKFVSDIEYGDRKPSLKTLCKLSRALSISTDFLLFGEENLPDEAVRKTLNENIESDSITAYHTNTEFTLTVKDEIYNSLYFDDFLTKKDKYSYFLGGNHGICKIENKSLENGKKMLIIKDSYANCIVPFLAEHYSEITLVDPRYCSHTQIKTVNASEYDDVLVLFNVSGFSSEQNFALTEFIGGK